MTKTYRNVNRLCECIGRGTLYAQVYMAYMDFAASLFDAQLECIVFADSFHCVTGVCVRACL